MKTLTIIMIVACLTASFQFIYAQNIAITDDDGYTANSSAMLDVKSITKGILVPRVTTLQRTNILSPATGLLVFDTDAGSFFFYSGAGWVNLSSGNPNNIWGITGSNVYLNNTAHHLGVGTITPGGLFARCSHLCCG
ncbi:MAG: hypothetical protein HY738_10890 [Bacteroidia bacterium]|nr:hypothetical protein [Bacteroidia bacterium]